LIEGVKKKFTTRPFAAVLAIAGAAGSPNLRQLMLG
jgi:hypothetical protein